MFHLSHLLLYRQLRKYTLSLAVLAVASFIYCFFLQVCIFIFYTYFLLLKILDLLFNEGQRCAFFTIFRRLKLQIRRRLAFLFLLKITTGRKNTDYQNATMSYLRVLFRINSLIFFLLI